MKVSIQKACLNHYGATTHYTQYFSPKTAEKGGRGSRSLHVMEHLLVLFVTLALEEEVINLVKHLSLYLQCGQ